jgi:diaminopimelate decarboxylase
VGDLVIVGGAGAYCAAMSTINYNSYPQAAEVMLDPNGTLRVIRRRQSLDQMLENEVASGLGISPSPALRPGAPPP